MRLKPSVIAAFSSASIRILGFLRDILMAHILGTGYAADAFLAAFRIPNAIRRILAEGGLNPAFLPLYSRLNSEDVEKARIFAQDAFSGFMFFLIAILALLEFFTSFFALFLFPGLEGETAELAIFCARLCFPLMAGISLAACLGALLIANNHLVMTAFAPNCLNIIMIAILLLMDKNTLSGSEQAMWLAAGAGCSGFVHLGCLIWATRRYLPWFRLTYPHITPHLRSFLKAAAPTILIVGTAQISFLVAVMVASFIPSGVSWLYYAEKLFQFPLGFVSAIAGLVFLPEMASAVIRNDKKRAITFQNRALEASLLFSLPAAAALYMLASPIMNVLFERGAFTASDTLGSAEALKGLAIGLPFAASGKIVSQTVFIVSRLRYAALACLAGIAATFFFALFLMNIYAVQGITLAVSLGLAVYMLICISINQQAGFWHLQTDFYSRMIRIFAATAIMVSFLFLYQSYIGSEGGLNLFLLCSGGFISYAASAFFMKALLPGEIALFLKEPRK